MPSGLRDILRHATHVTTYVAHLMESVSPRMRAVMPGNACAGIRKPPYPAVHHSFPARFGQSRMSPHA